VSGREAKEEVMTVKGYKVVRKCPICGNWESLYDVGQLNLYRCSTGRKMKIQCG